MKTTKKSHSKSQRDELRRLIEAQHRDAKTESATPRRGATEEPVVGADGALLARDALRDLVAPAPDEVLTRSPDDDDFSDAS